MKNTICPTCTRPPDAPYRSTGPSGAIVEGCIDACHTPAMQALTEAEVGACMLAGVRYTVPVTVAWHFTQSASEWRLARAIAQYRRMS